MNNQPVYAVGEKYIRIRETGSVFPLHVEQLKMVRKDLADLVMWNGTNFVKLDYHAAEQTEPVKISTPARKPEPVTPPPIVQRTFAPPAQGDGQGAAALQVQSYAPPAVAPAAASEVALAAARTAAEQNPAQQPLPTIKTVDLVIEPPPSE